MIRAAQTGLSLDRPHTLYDEVLIYLGEATHYGHETHGDARRARTTTDVLESRVIDTGYDLKVLVNAPNSGQMRCGQNLHCTANSVDSATRQPGRDAFQANELRRIVAYEQQGDLLGVSARYTSAEFE